MKSIKWPGFSKSSMQRICGSYVTSSADHSWYRNNMNITKFLHIETVWTPSIHSPSYKWPWGFIAQYGKHETSFPSALIIKGVLTSFRFLDWIWIRFRSSLAGTMIQYFKFNNFPAHQIWPLAHRHTSFKPCTPENLSKIDILSMLAPFFSNNLYLTLWNAPLSKPV